MGNYISCTLSTNAFKHSSKAAAKVILPNGEIRQFDQQIKAAEIMFDNPNHFLVNSQSLHIGRRFFALNADEDLEMGNVYVMFPMKRLTSVTTGADMAALFVITSSAAAKRASHRISDVPQSTTDKYNCGEKKVAKLNLDDMEDISVLGEIQHRLSMCRSRKPDLETIVEEPVC